VYGFTNRAIHAYGVLLYVIVAMPLIALALRYLAPRLGQRMTRRGIEVAVAVVVLGLLAAGFLVLFPLANSGKFGGGSDNDEALNVGISALLRGEFPYYFRTYLGAPLTPMPGELLFAAPFYALGNGAYQNLLWIAVYGLFLAQAAGRLGLGMVLLLGMLIASPELLREYVTGGDLGSNTIFVLTFVFLLIATVGRRKTSAVLRVAIAVILGIALSSRPNWMFLMPLVCGALAGATRWRTALLYTGLAVASAAAITLPFYLYDPSGFAPLHVASFIGHVDSYVPHASHAIYAATAIAALAVGVRQWQTEREAARATARPAEREAAPVLFYWRWTIVQALPLVVTAILLTSYEGLATTRSPYHMSSSTVLLASGQIYVFALLYAWTRANAGVWKPSAITTGAAKRTAVAATAFIAESNS
jgi:hypothetical protein